MAANPGGNPNLPQRILKSKLMTVAVGAVGVAGGVAAAHFLGKVLPHPVTAVGETLAWGATGAAVGAAVGAFTEDSSNDVMVGLGPMFGAFLGGAAALIGGAASWSVIPNAAPVIGSVLALGWAGIFGGAIASGAYYENVVER